MSPSSQPSQPSSQILRQFSQGNKLHIQVYRALMDAVVLDWTISLADKDRMKTCVVTYLAQEANESTTIDPFMPKTRTFLLENLRPNQSYQSRTELGSSGQSRKRGRGLLSERDESQVTSR